MENQPLVSVITITRNRGKLIGRCIDSVLNQTYKNIEHIVVDGASDDETDDLDDELEMAGLDRLELEFMDEDERREALEDAGLDPDDFDL